MSDASHGRAIRRIARELGCLAIYILLAIGATWPLARLLDRAVSDPGDPLLNAWILHWDWIGTFTSQPLFHANIFHPAKWSLAFSENLYGIALFTFPLRFAGASPLTAFNVAMIAAFASSGYGAHVFARTMLADVVRGWRLEAAGLVAGIYFALLPYRFEQLAHLQHLWAVWLPLTFAALRVLTRRPGTGSAILLGAAYFMNGISNVHWLLFAAVTVPILGFVMMLLDGTLSDRRTVFHLTGSFIAANLLLVPFLVPYEIVSNLYGMVRERWEISMYSARLADWTVGASRSRFWSDLNEPIRMQERTLFPGALILLLAIAGLAGRSRKSPVPATMAPPRRNRTRGVDLAIAVLAVLTAIGWAVPEEMPALSRIGASVPILLLLFAILVRLWLGLPRWISESGSLRASLSRSSRDPAIWVAVVMILVGFFGSLGLNGPFYTMLYSLLPPFGSLRVPARFAMIAYCGLSLLGSAGVAVLLRWSAGWKSAAVAIGAVGLMLAELWSAPIHWTILPLEQGAVYEWLEQAPLHGGVLELPVGGDHSYRYVYASTVHNRGIMNGVSGFSPPLHDELEADFNSKPIPPRAMQSLETNQASIIIVHNDSRDASPGLREWLSAQLASGHIQYLRRFPHAFDHDYVFAVSANEPPTRALKDTSSDAYLSTFLSTNAPTPVENTFGYLHRPLPDSEIHGRLEVEGWALSPEGIDSVDLLFDDERVRIRADLEPDPMVDDAYPGYPVARPRFEKVIEERPAGVHRDTDIIVEVIDGRGKVTRLPQRFFHWAPLNRAVLIEQWNMDELRELMGRMGYERSTADRIVAGEPIEELASAKIAELGGMTDRDFVRTLYEVILQREPDQPGLELYENRLALGSNRESVLRMFLASEEFRRKYSEE